MCRSFNDVDEELSLVVKVDKAEILFYHSLYLCAIGLDLTDQLSVCSSLQYQVFDVGVTECDLLLVNWAWCITVETYEIEVL